MNKRFKDYLQQCSPAPADETMLGELRREMDRAVPEIAENIRRREELAAELRTTGSRPSEARQGSQS